MLIDALNPGSRESESEVAIVIRFASAISSNVPALDHRPFLSVSCLWSIECQCDDGIDRIVDGVSMD
jgi:hypothetical protein